jgi:hypothetical protein
MVSVFIMFWLCSCTTVAIYQTPISDFQIAVNAANDTIRPYLLEVNALNAKANLYDKLGLDEPWGTEDLRVGIPPEEIQVRLQALSTIASYANALSQVANSKDVDDLQQAAKTLGDDVNGLSTTIQGLTAKRAKSGQSALSKQAATLDLSGPVASLVTLFGTLAIEHMQVKAIEAAISNGDPAISQLIDLLKADLRALTLVEDASYDAMRTGMVKVYEDARKTASPRELISLIDEFVAKNDSLVALRAIQIDSLLSDMQSAHTAMVTFAKSSKSPKDLSDLAGQINVFTAHVKLVDDVISSIRASAMRPK